MLPVVTVPGCVFFYIRQFPGGRWAGWVGIACVAAAYLTFLFISFVYGFEFMGIARRGESFSWSVAWYLWLLAWTAPASLAGAGAHRQPWRWIGVAASFVAFFLAVNYSARENHLGGIPHISINYFIVVQTLAIFSGLTNLLTLLRLKSTWYVVRLGTLSAGLVAAAAVDFLLISDASVSVPPFSQIAAVTGISCACGVVAISLFVSLRRNLMPERLADEPSRLTLICPVCQKKLEAAIGEGAAGQSACSHCGMIFLVQARLPRCPDCNYLLFMLQSDRCPKCGRAIERGASILGSAFSS